MPRYNKKIIDFWAKLSPSVIKEYSIKGIIYVDPVDDSVEKLCKKCNEYWPLTSEFWYGDKNLKLGVHSWCKACYRNIRAENEANRARG